MALKLRQATTSAAALVVGVPLEELPLLAASTQAAKTVDTAGAAPARVVWELVTFLNHASCVAFSHSLSLSLFLTLSHMASLYRRNDEYRQGIGSSGG